MIDEKYQTPAEVQEIEYEFPYHHLPRCDSPLGPSRSRHWSSAFEYLCRLRHLWRTLSKLRPSSVLEMGCGDGRIIGSLETVPNRVGYDISSRALGYARAFYPKVTFVDDVSRLRESFDVVIATEVLEHIPDEDIGPFLTSCEAHVRPGGHLVVTVPTETIPVQAKHIRHYNEEALLQTLAQFTEDLQPVQSENLCPYLRVLRWYNRLTLNRYWTIDILALNRFIFRYYMKVSEDVDQSSSTCLMVVFQKKRKLT